MEDITNNPGRLRQIFEKKGDPIAPIPAPVPVDGAAAAEPEADLTVGTEPALAVVMDEVVPACRECGQNDKPYNVDTGLCAPCFHRSLAAEKPAKKVRGKGSKGEQEEGTEGTEVKRGRKRVAKVVPDEAARIVGGDLAVTVNPKRLLAVLQKLKPASSPRGTLPVLSCVRLTVTGVLRLEVTNLDIYAEAFVPLEEDPESAGSVLVSMARLMELVKLAEGEELRLEAEEGVLRIECGDWRAKLLTLDPAEFPSAPAEPQAGEILELPEKTLARMLALAVVAVSTDTTRYVLNGVRLLAEDGEFLAEATDGRRLVQVRAGLECADVDLIMPTAAVRLVLGFLGAGEATVRLVRTARFAECAGAGWSVRCKLIEGNYPNTNQVVPRAFGEEMSLDRARFVAMLNRGEVLANDGHHAVEVAIEKTGRATINSRTADVGEWEESLPVCAATERPERLVKFRANAAYLMALEGPACEQVRLQVQKDAANGPLLWTCREGAEPEIGWQYVQMPLGDAK